MAQTGMKAGGRFARIGWALVGSAAGHVLVLSACVVLGMAAAGRHFPAFVQVVLVGGFPAGNSPVVRQGPAVPDGGREKTPGPLPSVKPGAPYAPESSETGDVPSADPVFPPTHDTAVPAPLPAVTGIPPAVAEGPVPASPAPVPVETREKSHIEGVGPTVGDTGVEGKAQRFAPQGPSAGMARSGLPPAGGSGGDGRIGSQARLLRDRIESRIVYPEEAVRRGQEGVVLLRIRVGEGGIPKEVRVARSSGARVLDEAARTGVVRSAPLPSIPGWFEVPVRFLLR